MTIHCLYSASPSSNPENHSVWSIRSEDSESLRSMIMAESVLYFAMRQQQEFVVLSSTPEHKQVKFLEKSMTNNWMWSDTSSLTRESH